MRRTLALVALALLTAAPSAELRAQGDPRRDARLLYVEGKFREADQLVDQAGPEVANDLAFRAQLADAATKFLKSKQGQERREGLEAAKRNWAVVANAEPANGAAVAGAVLAAKEIAELDLAKKNGEAARSQASWALALGEKAAAAGLTPETKAALAEAYGLRASTTRKVEQADQISSDYRKGAQMLEEASAGHAKASEWLAAAADLRFREAFFVHDSIPLETEKRDDEAIVAAAQLARRACEVQGAAEASYVLHIKALCAAHDWKVAADLGAPFMEPLKPAVDGLALQVPKGANWKRSGSDKDAATRDWELMLERSYDPNDSAVQIMLIGRPQGEAIGARTWADVEEGVATLYDKRKNGYSDVASESAPVLLGEKKKGGQVWFFQVAGTVAGSSRRNKSAEWVWPSATRKSTVWDLRVVDWRRTTSIEDPDIVAFVQSAIPPGLWPPGTAKPPEEPKGKKPPKKK
jgi:hypothetical protein